MFTLLSDPIFSKVLRLHLFLLTDNGSLPQFTIILGCEIVRRADHLKSKDLLQKHREKHEENQKWVKEEYRGKRMSPIPIRLGLNKRSGARKVVHFSALDHTKIIIASSGNIPDVNPVAFVGVLEVVILSDRSSRPTGDVF